MRAHRLLNEFLWCGALSAILACAAMPHDVLADPVDVRVR